MPKSSNEIAVLESELKGKTLLVYWYILKSSSHVVGVREVQRALKFSSPSIAVYHLEKLKDLGLIRKKPTGEYILKEEVKVGLLRFFTHLGRFLVPRYLFYSIWISTMLITYLIFYGFNGSIHNFYALMFGLIASTILWFETVRLWREKPF